VGGGGSVVPVTSRVNVGVVATISVGVGKIYVLAATARPPPMKNNARKRIGRTIIRSFSLFEY
jgi:hypothetical protein